MEIITQINDKIADIKVLIEAPTNELANEVSTYLSKMKESKNLTVKTSDGLQVIHVNEIAVIEVYADELVISSITGETTRFRGRLYKIKKCLNERQFVQINKSTIINLRQLKKLENSFSGNMTAILKNGKKQSVSRRYLTKLKQILK